jgi:hypothetical protein
VTSFGSNNPVDYTDVSNCQTARFTGDVQDATNKAYAKFVEEVQDSAEMAVNLAERKQAMQMMGSRLVQLATFARHLKRLDFRAAAKALSVPSGKIPVGLKAHAKAFGSNFLEFHFGWEPAVKDIYNAIDILQRTWVPPKIRVREAVKNRHVYSDTATHLDTITAKVWVTLAAEIKVTNPNLWRANQLGLVNPATFAVELIPLSFLLDWFVNVSQFLNSFTDFLGIDIINPRTTTVQYAIRENRWYNGYMAQYTNESILITRATSIAGPTLRAKYVTRISPIRGATACSLLVGHLEDAVKVSSKWRRRGPMSPWSDLHIRGF